MDVNRSKENFEESNLTMDALLLSYTHSLIQKDEIIHISKKLRDELIYG